MDVTYKVEFELTESTESAEVTRSVDTSITPKANPAKKGFIDRKTAKPIMVAYGVYKVASNIAVRQATNDMTLRGDTLAAKMHQEKIARQEKIIGTAFSFGMGLAVKGTLGALFIGMEAFKLATEAINLSMANKNLIERTRQEKYASSLEQARFSRNSTTEAIRW